MGRRGEARRSGRERAADRARRSRPPRAPTRSSCARRHRADQPRRLGRTSIWAIAPASISSASSTICSTRCIALGKPIIVVLINGRPPPRSTIAEKANALIEGWYLGQEGGNAWPTCCSATVNPGGKLPVTIARDVGQLPMFYNHKPSARRGYLFDTTAPLFPFGWGLSYTNFAARPPRLSTPDDRPGRLGRRRGRRPEYRRRAPATRSCSSTSATR